MADATRRVRRMSCLVFALALVLTLVPQVAFADHHEAQGEGAPEMSEEQKAMMQAWEKAMTPGPEHEWLASQAGEYDLEIKMWMEPGAEPTVSEGSSSAEMIMGGRILRETVESSFMGQPFTGEAMTGYDNVTGRYWSTWVDNMSTAVGVSWGEREGDTLSMDTTFPDPMTGEMKTTRMTVDYTDTGMVMKAYETMDGEEVQTMEITYTAK